MSRFSVASILLIFFLVFFATLTPPAISQTSGYLEDGISQYQADHYEEAVELFRKARTDAPRSTKAAFWLGLAYKIQGQFQEALPHLTDAVAFTPPIREAVVELIDVLYRLNRLEEAKKWLDVAERDEIYPAKTAFLRGMVLIREDRHQDAILSFEKSKSLDKSYTQAAEFQIGIALMLSRKYSQAGDRFRTAVTQDPVSDLGTYARRYQAMVEERAWVERPVRLSLNVLGQYDTNMIQEPNAYPGLVDAGEEKSFGLLSTLRVDVVPTLPGSLLFNASYALSSSPHEQNSTSYDTLLNSLSIAPGYNFGRFAVNLAANYTHVLKRNPNYENYSDSTSVGPLVRVLLTERKNQILELYGGYQRKNYFIHPLIPSEERTCSGLSSYISWMRLYENGAILMLKYGFESEVADGSNWTNQGYRFTVNSIMPLIWSKLKFQLGAEVLLQDYANESTIPAFEGKKRRDTIFTGMAGLILDVHRNLSLMLQYTGIRDDSNIFLYDYDRNIFSLGMEFRF